jgi:hypothetical protein
MKNTYIDLNKIVREQLSSVEFVQDYIQLHFDGPTLTAFVLPTVQLPEKKLGFGDFGYRDELCARIGRKVVLAELVEANAITVRFDDGAVIEISLKPEDSVGPEAGHFRATADSRSPLLSF